ncbi:MAG: response regulator [Desulfobacterales bacterium]|nr:response regulator [Desulfobacterales bacterium]
MEKKRILIADDEDSVRNLLARALKSYAYEIDVVENGAKAINQMDRKSYDLIITDYMMPLMDGLELTRRIKEKYPSMPILIITANGPVDDLLESGATACIIKPFNIFDLMDTIKNLLDKER